MSNDELQQAIDEITKDEASKSSEMPVFEGPKLDFEPTKLPDGMEDLENVSSDGLSAINNNAIDSNAEDTFSVPTNISNDVMNNNEANSMTAVSSNPATNATPSLDENSNTSLGSLPSTDFSSATTESEKNDTVVNNPFIGNITQSSPVDFSELPEDTLSNSNSNDLPPTTENTNSDVNSFQASQQNSDFSSLSENKDLDSQNMGNALNEKNLETVKIEALRELYPLLPRMKINARQKFDICIRAITEIGEEGAAKVALDATKEMTDETEKGECLLRLIEATEKKS